MLKPDATARPDTYRVVYSKDPALRPVDLPAPPSDDADAADHEAFRAAAEAALVERENALRVARETRNYDQLLAGAERPTYFVCRWIPQAVRGRWNDQHRAAGGAMGLHDALAQLFLLAVVRVENFPTQPRMIHSDRFGCEMASEDFLDDLTRAVGHARAGHLIRDVAGQIYEQEVATGPL